MIELHNILCPTDFSESSRAATNYALEFARTFQARLHLLYVIEDPILIAPVFGGYTPQADQLEGYAQVGLDNWISEDDATGVTIERRWAHGRPFVQILQDAAGHDIDLIVMGTHGRGFLPHLLLGSVAERVIREAVCPVLTVRPVEFAYQPLAGGIA